jgi:putative membrane protein
MLALSIVAWLGVYAAGLSRLWRSAGIGRGVRMVQALAFGCGMLALLAAVSGSLDEWSERSLAAHMVQHELLMVVAAPLVAAGAPLVAALWAMPEWLRTGVTRRVRRGWWAVFWRVLTAPLSVFAVYALALWVWHLPVLYDFALEHEAAHAVQHLCFFATAVLFWWGISHGRYGRAGYGAAVGYVFVTAVHGGVLGALLTFSSRVWYAPYLAHRVARLTPLEDQQLAGLLMWIPAGFAFVAGGLVLFAAWLRQSDRLSRFDSRTRVRARGSR